MKSAVKGHESFSFPFGQVEPPRRLTCRDARRSPVSVSRGWPECLHWARWPSQVFSSSSSSSFACCRIIQFFSFASGAAVMWSWPLPFALFFRFFFPPPTLLPQVKVSAGRSRLKVQILPFSRSQSTASVDYHWSRVTSAAGMSENRESIT